MNQESHKILVILQELVQHLTLPLNLIEPLGFKLEDKYLKRAGLDYWPLVKINKYGNFDKFLESKPTKRIISFSKKKWDLFKGF